MFDACVELDGPTERTFEVAIKVQIDNGGWMHFFESAEESERRLRKVAELFPDRADEFIAKSAVNWILTEHSPSKLLVPGDKLVFFLVCLKRYTEAAELVKSMATSLIADSSGVVLATPGWAK